MSVKAYIEYLKKHFCAMQQNIEEILAEDPKEEYVSYHLATFAQQLDGLEAIIEHQ